MQSPTIFKLRLDRARSRDTWSASDNFIAHAGLATWGDYGLERCTNRDRFVGQTMQFMKIGIAEYETISGIPQDEGFGDGLDRVAQPHIGGDSFFDQVFLLRNVD